ncbi:TPA: head-tail joining protein [Providencia alcalifaciens]
MRDNPFDRAMAKADNAILQHLGRQCWIEIAGRKISLRGVLDEPVAGVQLKRQAGQIHDVAPRLFVKSSDIAGMKPKARVDIGGQTYWVVTLDPDDNGYCYLTLARGKPGHEYVTPEWG